MNNLIFIKDFIANDIELFNQFKDSVIWQAEMKNRKTASYGIPYNSTIIDYKYQSIPRSISIWFPKIRELFGFIPNNVLLNFYYDSSSKMGFHSDDLSILEPGTGVVIISLGSTRTMQFKNKISSSIHDYSLNSGSLIFLNESNQLNFLHSILPTDNINNKRISITLRKLKSPYEKL